jgi:hypothetical protein
MGHKILSMTLAIVLTAVVSGGGVYIWQNSLKNTTNDTQKEEISKKEDQQVKQVVKEEDVEPLLYSTKGVNVKFSKEIATFDYTAAQLWAMADECGSTHEERYFERLVAAYKDTSKTMYKFKYNGDSQESDTFIATVLQNRMEYASLDGVKKDFDLCAAGGDMYPTAMNSRFILFVNSCGTGFDDGSDKPVGCEEVRKVVEPTLKLNPETLLVPEISEEEQQAVIDDIEQAKIQIK